MRLVRGAALVVGLVLLALSLGTALVQGRAQKQADMDAALRQVVSRRAAEVDNYFERARAISLLTAHNPAFSAFYAAPGARREKVRAHGTAARHAERALGYLERLYPDSIGEACFIDRSGSENARVVRGEVAGLADLSDDEADAPFFDGAFAQRVGSVYQSAPYVSPDTDEWVISNATPVPGTGSRPSAIVHFEVTVDSFRGAGTHGATARGATGSGGPFSLLLVDGRDGRVLNDSRRPQRVGAPLGVPADTGFTELVRGLPATGIRTLPDGRRIAFQRLATTEGNANEWIAVAAAPHTASWGSGVGAAPLALLAAAALALALAAVGFRTYQRALQRVARTDALTGLPNRVALAQRITAALHRREPQAEVAVLLLDLDRFKDINDTLGHGYGDELLRHVAARLVRQLRAGDAVARLGGDEYAVLLTDLTAPGQAVATAERIRTALQAPFTVHDVTLDVEASIGVAVSPGHGDDAEQLLARADTAMYRAKTRHAGVVLYDPAAEDGAPRRLALFGDLRRALERGELVLHYQPKVALDDRTVVGVEALVRWAHPERGLVPPDQFIPLAESTGLIERLTSVILEQALTQARQWLDAGHPVPVAVNTSPRNLADLTFPDQVLAALHRHGVPAALLRLEITESAVMAEPDRSLQVLVGLRSAGVGLSIDDFGTGYSSMAYLKRLPVDELKIDRAFVRDMTTDADDETLVRSMIDLGHNLGLTVVAEGVEDAATARALRLLGCDVAQGYHFSRPVPADQVELSRRPGVTDTAR